MGSNSISNNSNNIRVNSNYTNKKYGSTIGKSGGSSQAALASRARTANTEEFDLSSPTVITEKENILKKSEITERIENWIMYLDNTGKSLKEEKDALTEKSRRFADSANRGRYPELFYEEKDQGSRKKYLSPSEAIKSDKCFKKYLKENGYPTDRERMSTDKYNLLKKQYADYINTTYTEKYSECFNEFVGMTYADYRERLTQINSDIENIKASRYELVQQAKEQPYIELMDTDDFQNYITNNKNNPNSELYKLYGIKNGTVEINDDSYWRFEYFTEQDMLIFSYLWDTQSPKVAREYVEAIEDKLNKAEGLANAEKFLDSIRDENGNIDPDVWAGVLSSAKGFENGVSTFFEGLGNVFNGEGMMSISQYEQMYILNELTNSSGNYIGKLANKIMENQGEEAVTDFISKIYNKETNTIDLEYAKTVLSEQEYNNLVIKINTDKKSILDNVYELSSSAGNMLPSMIVSMAVSAVATPAAGSVVGSTLMGISSGGNSKNQALVQGNDLFTSTMYGVFSGVSETTLGLLLGNIPGLNESATFSFRGLVKEGFEEMLQEYVDAGLRASLLDETIDLDQLGDDAFKSFIYGALMSGIMNGGKLVFTIKNGIQSTKINSVQELVNFVKETGVDIDTSQIEGIMSDTQQSSVSSNSSIGESKVQTSNINSGNLDIDNQIAMANYHTGKGRTTTIDIDSVSSLTESQINSIKNVDNVIFRLPDGSNMNISQLLQARLNLSGKTISGSTNVSMDLDSQIARANMYNKSGNFASIDVTDITMMTDEVLSKIDNVDNVVFRLPDGSSLSYNQLIEARNSTNGIQETKSFDSGNRDIDLNAEYIIENDIFKKYKNAGELQYAYMHKKVKMNLKEYADAMKAFEVRDVISLKNKLGMELEKIFFDDDYVIGVHRTGAEGNAVEILKNGLYLTGHTLSGGAGDTSGIDLKKNITFHTEYIDFIKALSEGATYKTYGFGYGDAIIVKIPKADIKNFDKILDFSDVTPVLKPEYLVGSVRSQVDLSSKKIKIMDIVYNLRENNGIDSSIDNQNIINDVEENIDNISAEEVSHKKIMQKSDFNKKNLIQGIIGDLPSNADPLTIARIIYLKLNQSVTYSDTFFASTDNNFRADTYYRKYDINDLLNMNNNEIVCSGWSQLYKELLVCAGFDESKIKIESGKGEVSHKYVSVDFGNGQLLLADGTSNISGITDLAASKIGDETGGFAFVDKLEFDKIKSTEIKTIDLFKKISSNRDIITAIDDAIGYRNSDFKKDIFDITDYYWHEGIDIATENKAQKFIEMFDNENQSAIECYPVFKRYANSIIGNDVLEIAHQEYGENVVAVIKFKKSDGGVGYIIKKNKTKMRLADTISDIISEIKSYTK